jgi:hypothetical protein
MAQDDSTSEQEQPPTLDDQFGKGGEPETPEQWQWAVDAAHCLMLIESAKAYGLVTGGPTTKEARCIDILERGAALGYTPKDDPDLLKAILTESGAIPGHFAANKGRYGMGGGA